MNPTVVGGAVLLWRSSLIVQYSIFKRNSVDGIWGPSLRTVDGNGGAIAVMGSTGPPPGPIPPPTADGLGGRVEIFGCLFDSNYVINSDNGGGALFIGGRLSSVTITATTFLNNSATSCCTVPSTGQLGASCQGQAISLLASVGNLSILSSSFVNNHSPKDHLNKKDTGASTLFLDDGSCASGTGPASPEHAAKVFTSAVVISDCFGSNTFGEKTEALDMILCQNSLANGASFTEGELRISLDTPVFVLHPWPQISLNHPIVYDGALHGGTFYLCTTRGLPSAGAGPGTCKHNSELPTTPGEKLQNLCSPTCATQVFGNKTADCISKKQEGGPGQGVFIWAAACTCAYGDFLSETTLGRPVCTPCRLHSSVPAARHMAIGNRSCQCVAGYMDASNGQCIANPCKIDGNPCDNGATCKLHYATANEPGFKCLCLTGWWGDRCQLPNVCLQNATTISCGNGRCVPKNTTAGFVCSCDDGFTGATCHQKMPAPPPPKSSAYRVVLYTVLAVVGGALTCCGLLVCIRSARDRRRKQSFPSTAAGTQALLSAQGLLSAQPQPQKTRLQGSLDASLRDPWSDAPARSDPPVIDSTRDERSLRAVLNDVRLDGVYNDVLAADGVDSLAAAQATSVEQFVALGLKPGHARALKAALDANMPAAPMAPALARGSITAVESWLATLGLQCFAKNAAESADYCDIEDFEGSELQYKCRHF